VTNIEQGAIHSKHVGAQLQRIAVVNWQGALCMAELERLWTMKPHAVLCVSAGDEQKRQRAGASFSDW